MRNQMVILGAVLILLLYPTSEASAQFWQAGRLGDDIGSLGIIAGVVSPTTTLPDGSSHDAGTAIGATGTVWPLDYLGARASVVYGKTAGVHGERFSAAAAHDPKVFLYSAELAIRYPFAGERFSWFPYLSGGPGAKSYRWAIDRPRVGDTSFAWSIGGGVDVRPTRSGSVGIQVDVRNYQSRYQWHGLGYRAAVPDDQAWGPILNDVVITAGLTLNR